MDLRLNAADAAVQADYKKTIYENPLQFSYTGNFNYEAIPLTKRVIGMWKVLPLAVMTVAQLAKAILYSPLALASTKVDIAQGEMYKVAYLARRTFAHTIAPFYNCDQKAQRLDFAARYSATCETIRREKYEQKTVTAEEYLDAPEELQAHLRERFSISDAHHIAFLENDAYLENVTLSWTFAEVMLTVISSKVSASAAAVMTEHVAGMMRDISVTPVRSTVVANLADRFGGASPSRRTDSSPPESETTKGFDLAKHHRKRTHTTPQRSPNIFQRMFGSKKA